MDLSHSLARLFPCVIDTWGVESGARNYPMCNFLEYSSDATVPSPRVKRVLLWKDGEVGLPAVEETPRPRYFAAAAGST